MKTGGRMKSMLELFHYLKGLKLYMAFNCAVGLIFNIIPLAISFVMSYMAGLLLAGQAESGFPILLVVLVLVVLRAVFCYGDLWFSHDIAYRILFKIRQQIYERLEKCIPSFQSQMGSVEMATIATQDVEYLEWFYAHTVNSLIISLITSLVIIGVMYALHPDFALILLFSVVLTYFVPYLFSKKSKEDGAILRAANAKLEESIGEGIQGMREIIGFDWDENFIRSYQSREAEYNSAYKVDAKRRGKEAMVADLIREFTSISLLLLSIWMVSEGSLSIAYVPVVMSMSVLVFSPLAGFMAMTQQFSTIFAATERVIGLLEFPLLSIHEGDLEFPEFIESIDFENVSYRYPGHEDYVLKNVSFSLYGGEFVSLAGISGSGKTTIVNLLQRYIEPETGVIRLNGRDIREYKLSSWKKGYAIVRQGSYLFNQTIAANILMNKTEGGMEEVEEASRLAEAHQFINRLKDGYETVIGEKGSRLSGGEKQRIAIARALIKDAPILILDEATANIDNKNEALLFDNLSSDEKKRLILSVAHKPSTIERSDRVIFLMDGEVEASGEYEYLRETSSDFRKQILGINA